MFSFLYVFLLIMLPSFRFHTFNFSCSLLAIRRVAFSSFNIIIIVPETEGMSLVLVEKKEYVQLGSLVSGVGIKKRLHVYL